MSKRTAIQLIWRIFWLDMKLSPGWIILDASAMFFSAICYGLATVVKQVLFDKITDVVLGKDTVGRLIFIVVIIVLFQFANEMINAICNFTWAPAMRSTSGRIREKIHAKISNLPMNSFEKVDSLEQIEKAVVGSDFCYGVYNSIATILLFYLPFFVFIGIYLFRFSPVLPFSILMILVPLVISLIVRKRIYFDQMDKIVPYKREKDNYETEIYSNKSLKENRVFGVYHYFEKKYSSANENYCKAKWGIDKKNGIAEILLRCLSLLGYFGVLSLLIWNLGKGTITVGAFAAVFSSITTMIAFMNDAISNHLANMFEQVGSLGRLLDFFDMPEEPLKDDELNLAGTIEVKNVSFSYPGTNVKAVDNVSFTIRDNETIAVVGENGAGKSTLVRIVMGLLRPDSGSVYVDGKDIYSLSMASRFKYTSAVFQKFCKYKFSVKENVYIATENEDEERLKRCLAMSEFVEERELPNGYDSVLSKEFDGIELSGGQWQRLAIARGLFKPYGLMVLDEPTSAIDPIQESALYKQFVNITQKSKAIIVTHRLGSARSADRVLVLKKGCLVEEGFHSELLERKGEYAELYNEQARWYTQND